MIHGQRREWTFNQAAAHFLRQRHHKASVETDVYLLKSVMPYIGELGLQQVHDGTLEKYVQDRLAAGRSHKTVNLALGVVRNVLMHAWKKWRDDQGRPWLDHPPGITMLPLAGYQREPRPISWSEQDALLSCLPPHLRSMALFVLNTGVRDDVVCNLRWSWEEKLPELGVSVFEVPPQHVKGGGLPRIIVCNSIAQSVIEQQRGKHLDFVFVWRRERVKNFDQDPAMPYRPVQTMNNTAWQSARLQAGIEDLHVHDLRHTVGMRLREARVPESTCADVLWHAGGSITDHYTMGQITELHEALERITDSSGQWNRSLGSIRAERRKRVGSDGWETTSVKPGSKRQPEGKKTLRKADTSGA